MSFLSQIRARNKARNASEKLYRQYLDEEELKQYYEKSIEPFIPTVRDVVKAALNSKSPGEGSRIAELGFSLSAVNQSGVEAMTNPIVRKEITKLADSIDKVRTYNPKRHRKLKLIDEKGRPILDVESAMKYFTKDGKSCAYCGEDFGNSAELKQHIAEDHLSHSGTFESTKNELSDDRRLVRDHRREFDEEMLDQRDIYLDRINEQVAEYLDSEYEQEKRTKIFHPELASQDVGTLDNKQALGLKGVPSPSQMKPRLRPIGERDLDEQRESE